MFVVKFVEPVSVQFRKSAGSNLMTFEAGRDYLFSSSQYQTLHQNKNLQARIYKVSKADMRLANFHVSCRRLGSQRLLFYNGGGGYGDQIMTWPVAKILADIGFEVHILTDPGNASAWWGHGFIKSIQTVPLSWELVKMYDYHVFFEHVSNMDEHQDQLHPVDAMLHKLGIDPVSVDKKLKVVRPLFTYSESWSTKVFEDKKIAIFQPAATNPVRSLTASDSAFLLCKLAESFPDLHWLAVYDEFVNQAYLKALECPNCDGKGALDQKIPVGCPDCRGNKQRAANIEVKNFANLRELWALTERAKIVVSPDSMMAHVAGSMAVPCVGLWGPMAPNNRVKYYENHFPIYHQKLCGHSPCFCYSNVFPRYCPPRPPSAPRTVCEVLAGISPEEVAEAVAKIRRA